MPPIPKLPRNLAVKRLIRRAFFLCVVLDWQLPGRAKSVQG